MVRELDAALANYARVVARPDAYRYRARRFRAARSRSGGRTGRRTDGIRRGDAAIRHRHGLRGVELRRIASGRRPRDNHGEEGRADRSTIFNKAPAGVARHAQAHGVPTVLLAGSLGPGYEELYDHSVAAVICIADRPMSFRAVPVTTAENCWRAPPKTPCALYWPEGEWPRSVSINCAKGQILYYCGTII